MRKPIRIVPIAVGFVILLVMFILTASGVYRSGLSDGAAYGIFSAMTVVLLVSMLLSMRRKYIDLAGVRVSKANRPGSESHLARMRNDYENDLKRQDRIELATSSDKDFVIQ